MVYELERGLRYMMIFSATHLFSVSYGVINVVVNNNVSNINCCFCGCSSSLLVHLLLSLILVFFSSLNNYFLPFSLLPLLL